MKSLFNLTSLIIVSVIFLFSYAEAKSNYILHIEVFDNENKPLVGVTGRIKNTVLGAYSDKEGQIYIKNLPLGDYDLQLSCVGYENKSIPVTISKENSHESHVNISVKLEEADILTEDVVVTGTRNEQLYQDVPVKISVVNDRVFQATSSLNISEGLSFQPGLRVENNCQNCGFTQVRLNGLEGQYSQILIDSRPVFSTLNGVYGLEQIPATMIDRIEVVRGGGSALYGGSAVGGVINIITKDPDQNSFNAGVHTSYIDGSVADITASANASIVDDSQKYGIYVFGVNRNRGHWDANGDGFSEISELEVNSLGARMFYNPNHMSRVSLEYHSIFDDRRGGDQFERSMHHANIAEATEHKTQSGGITYESYLGSTSNKVSAYLSFQNTNRKSFYGAKEILNSNEIVDAYGDADNTTYVTGLQYSHILDFLGVHIITTGYELNYDDLVDRAPAYNRVIEQFSRDHGFYLQDSWVMTEEFTFLFGARLDDHNMIDGLIFSPRANLMYKLTDEISLRTSISTGFRAPQTFDEDLHITQVGGEASLHTNSSDLKPEYSLSLNGSIDYNTKIGRLPLSLSLEYFNTKLNDVFYTVIISEEHSDLIIHERRNNPDGAIVQGMTFEAMTMTNNFDVKLGFTYQTAKYEKALEWNENDLAPGQNALNDRMLRTPDWYGYITLNWEVFEKLDWNISSVITGSMLVPHLAGGIGVDGEERFFDELVKTDAFLEVNTQIAYQISDEPCIDIVLGCQNLFNSFQNDFDRGLGRDAGYIYGPARPRTMFLGIKTDL